MDQIYRYFRWLSLDVVLGAIFFLWYLDQFYDVDVTFPVYFALGSAIWLIYTTDHLIDARRVVAPSGERHRFHRDHFGMLVLIGGVVMVVALINVVFLPLRIIQNGALLSAGCVGYLLLVYFFSKLWVKELLVAVVYAMGIFLAPMTLATAIGGGDVMLVIQLAMIAFLNLLIFSYFDLARDRKDGFGSLAMRLGPVVTAVVIHSTCILSTLTSAVIYLGTGLEIEVIFLLMNVVLYSVYLLPVFYDRGELFRTIGDGVFYLPLIFVL